VFIGLLHFETGSKCNIGENMPDTLNYEKYANSKQAANEALCNRCGACCGVFENDPCIKLKRGPDNRYFCSDYENRMGPQTTVNGNIFKCVTLREIRSGSWPGSWKCGYKKLIVNS